MGRINISQGNDANSPLTINPQVVLLRGVGGGGVGWFFGRGVFGVCVGGGKSDVRFKERATRFHGQNPLQGGMLMILYRGRWEGGKLQKEGKSRERGKVISDLDSGPHSKTLSLLEKSYYTGGD